MTNEKTPIRTEPELLTIKEFAARTMFGMTTAREMANSKVFCDAGISVRANPLKKIGGTRIDWLAYLEFVKQRPPVTEHRKTKGKRRESSLRVI